jgi:peptidoglycan glycosyltransferase
LSDELIQRRARVQHVGVALLGAATLIAAALVYWGVFAREAILARSDNPRLVEAELAIERGRILDAQGSVLAETRDSADGFQRSYPVSGTGAAIGYYSFRHGTAGVEEAYDLVLRGESGDLWSDYWRYEFLHEPRSGRDVRVSLDAGRQQAADDLLGDYRGAVVLMGVPDGLLKAIASHPSYDPNALEGNIESLAADEAGPLLNRATQGQYQPGLALQPFVIASALDAGTLSLDEEPASNGELLALNGARLACIEPGPEPTTWAEVLRRACPAPMTQVGLALGEKGLQDSFAKWGFYREPNVPLPTEVGTEQAIARPDFAAAGQDLLTVTPLQLALAFGALANEGQAIQPRLVVEFQAPSGVWQPAELGEPETAAASAGAAAEVLGSLTVRDNIAEHTAVAISGPEGHRNAWYLGLLRAGGRRQVVVVILEDTADVSAAQQIGRTLLQRAG